MQTTPNTREFLRKSIVNDPLYIGYDFLNIPTDSGKNISRQYLCVHAHVYDVYMNMYMYVSMYVHVCL